MGTTAFRSPSRDIFEKEQGFFESLSYPGDEYRAVESGNIFDWEGKRILYLMAEQSSNRRLTSRRCLEKIVGLFISLRFLGNWRNCNRNAGCLNQ